MTTKPPNSVRRGSGWGEAVFHVVFVAVGVANAYTLSARAQSNESVAQAGTASWFWLLLVCLWLVPSVFYLRIWAGDAIRTTLWARAPVVQFLGILLAALGALATLLLALGAVLVLMGQRGVEIALDPDIDHLTIAMVYSQLVWEASDALPLLGVTGALGWERPITDPGWPVGLAGIMGRAAVFVFVLWTFAYLVKHFRVALLPRPDSDPREGAGDRD